MRPGLDVIARLAKLEATDMIDLASPKPEPNNPTGDEAPVDSPRMDEVLDEALEESFPASDPPAVGALS
jgi:hypothetical protein